MRLGNHDNTSADYKKARKLRQDSSFYERKLWYGLREYASLKGLKFRRQHVVHPFIADFACMQARLLVELDGDSHDTRQAYDRKREAFLRRMGYHILRFTNEEVKENLPGVLERIIDVAEYLVKTRKRYGKESLQLQVRARRPAPLPNPPREGEGTPPRLPQVRSWLIDIMSS